MSKVDDLTKRIKDVLRPFVGRPNSHEVRSEMVDAVVMALAKWDIEYGDKEIPESRLLAAGLMNRHFGKDC